MSKPKFEDYDFIVKRLKPEDGGGYLIAFPDLPGRMSDGETPNEAVTNGREAFAAWVDTCIAEGWAVPAPGVSRNEPVRFVQRLPSISTSSSSQLLSGEAIRWIDAISHSLCTSCSSG
jgi:antitoxin HicB